MILSALAALPHHPITILPTLHTEETQNLNSDRVRATPRDTLARKDLGQCSGHSFIHPSGMRTFSPAPPSGNFGEEKEKTKADGLRWGCGKVEPKVINDILGPKNECVYWRSTALGQTPNTELTFVT
ncbi:unnamed protein product [Rangifer tarandus platyrhynchus]|uniref:Uncharacterized protein n=2 Tax=Rangifer tarandus platyrhynchus TaxID=3082113 RepID=A0ABN8ZGN7_RANTA|nr:unnamed protein product [Rangifer tarandus platyrhynchus]